MSTSGFDEKSASHGIELRLDQAIKGVAAGLPPQVVEVMLRGKIYNQAELLDRLQEINSRWKEVREAHRIIRQFTAEKPALVKEATEVLSDLNSVFAGYLGADSEALLNYGFKVKRKRRKLTVEEAVIRTEKARRTRELRNPLNKREREALKAGPMTLHVAIPLPPNGSAPSAASNERPQ
jgi:hypothetical protein